MQCIILFSGQGESSHPQECSLPVACPQGCLCTDGIVDCRNAGLTTIPDSIPDGVTEL